MSDDPVRERLVRAMEDNMTRIDAAVSVCVKAEADHWSAVRDWQASVMALRDYDERQPRCAAARRGDGEA